METLKFGKHKIEVYEGSRDLPMVRYRKFNLYLLRDSVIGSDIDQVIKTLGRLDNYLKSEQLDEARVERANLQQALFNTLNEVNFTQMAFVCLIHSINGLKVEDLTETGIAKIVSQLDGMQLPQRFIMEMVEKKKTLLTGSLMHSSQTSLVAVA